MRDPKRVARSIVTEVLTDSARLHPDPAVRDAARRELNRRQQAQVDALRGTFEQLGRAYRQVYDTIAAATSAFAAGWNADA